VIKVVKWIICLTFQKRVLDSHPAATCVGVYHMLKNVYLIIIPSGCRSCDRMVVGFTTTCTISAYHH
jgi:hypothetical protein